MHLYSFETNLIGNNYYTMFRSRSSQWPHQCMPTLESLPAMSSVKATTSVFWSWTARPRLPLELNSQVVVPPTLTVARFWVIWRPNTRSQNMVRYLEQSKFTILPIRIFGSENTLTKKKKKKYFVKAWLSLRNGIPTTLWELKSPSRTRLPRDWKSLLTQHLPHRLGIYLFTFFFTINSILELFTEPFWSIPARKPESSRLNSNTILPQSMLMLTWMPVQPSMDLLSAATKDGWLVTRCRLTSPSQSWPRTTSRSPMWPRTLLSTPTCKKITFFFLKISQSKMMCSILERREKKEFII